MLTPAAVVAVKMLEALDVTTKGQARDVLALWCRPSPRLAPADVRAILATYPEPEVRQAPADLDDGEHYEREEPETGGELPPHVGGYPLGRQRRGEDEQ